MFAFLFGPASTATSIYEFKVDGLSGGQIDFSKYKGKKILIVNTASKCGYTPQYSDLEKLYEKYKDKLVIVGFPANNFLWQEPGSNNEIAEFCKKNYDVTFPMAAKWNFEKFLIDENGKLIHRFRSSVLPTSPEITKYL